MAKIKYLNSLNWIFEPLQNHPEFFQKKMFGCEAGYLNGRLVLMLADSKEPWNGILIPTNHEHHALLQKNYPELQKHPVLGKWLYISQIHPNFEEVASEIIKEILKGNSLIGVEPKTRRRT